MVPIFTKFFYPVLKFLSDNEVRTLKTAQDYVADYFHFSDEDRQEKIKSGRATKVYDRLLWTMTYLRAAGLIASPKRGQYVITPKGHEVLDSGVKELNQKYLCEISPEFEAFFHGKKPAAHKSDESTGAASRQ